ncbi:MAG: hypothetical protein M0006_17705 [Magnetospirillum sp.]|nr:hypothetical protein [Magnetospirillum sp.]
MLSKILTLGGMLGTAAAVLLVSSKPAEAVPSYARQTGLACEACHTVFPQLTPFGRRFKLNGYTLTTKQGVSDINDKKGSTLSLADLPPISAMVQATTTWWNAAPNENNKSLPSTAKVQNGDVMMPRQLSLFYAGRISDHLGAYLQLTYDGTNGSIGIDNSDIRYSDHTGDNKWVWGVSVNNNPGVQDAWENNAAGWGFPFIKPAQYAGAKYAFGGAEPQIMNLGQTSAGVGAYTFYDNSLYAEFSLYRSTAFQRGGVVDSQVAVNGNPAIENYAPYWRVAYEKDWSNNSLQFGTSGMYMKLNQNGTDANGNTTFSPGLPNNYTDLGLDAQYQYIQGDHVAEFTTNYWHESSDNNSTWVSAGNATNTHDNVNWFEAVGSYWYQRKIGGSVAFTKQWGSNDAALYGNSLANFTSSINGSPDTQWETLELDYLPWLNTKLMLQYNIYNEVMGGSTFNQGGRIRSAMDNNTLMAGMWVAF